MTYSEDTIIRDVRVAMGLNPEAEPAWHADAVSRQLTPDQRIRQNIENAARQVCAEADESMLAECTRPLTATAAFRSDECGSISLPPDFMRLCSFCMDDWEMPVTKPIDADSSAYRMQHSRYAGLRGNPQRPACAIVCAPGGRILEFYGCKSKQAKIKSAAYHPYPTLADGELANMPGALYPMLIARLAQMC